jgi:hypothetical protein
VPILPVTCLRIGSRGSIGASDLALVEPPTGSAALWRSASSGHWPTTGPALAVNELPVADVDALVVELRRATLGNHLAGEDRCAVRDVFWVQ